MLSREPYALQSYNYQRSKGMESRPPNHHAYSAPTAGHYYDEHCYNDYRRFAYGVHRGARRCQDHAGYRGPPQGSHPYPVDTRDGEIPSWAMEDAYRGDDIYGDEGEEFNPREAYALYEGYTPASHSQSKSDMVASATSTSYVSLQSGSPRMKSNNPFRKA